MHQEECSKSLHCFRVRVGLVPDILKLFDEKLIRAGASAALFSLAESGELRRAHRAKQLLFFKSTIDLREA
jgi:hypothetical protein